NIIFLQPSTNFVEELKRATTRRKQSLEISNGRSDEEDNSPESSTSTNSRPTTPVANRLKEVGVNNLVYQINRDTLVNEPHDNLPSSGSPAISSIAKAAP
ncbi:unnamed protein product, partial [Rotaria magnacalcarata]